MHPTHKSAQLLVHSLLPPLSWHLLFFVIPEGDLLLFLLLLFVLNVVILSEAKNPCISPLLFVLHPPTNSA